MDYDDYQDNYGDEYEYNDDSYLTNVEEYHDVVKVDDGDNEELFEKFMKNKFKNYDKSKVEKMKNELEYGIIDEEPVKKDIDIVQVADDDNDDEFFKMFMKKKPKGEAKLKIKKMNKKLKYSIIEEPVEEILGQSEPIEVLEDDTDLPPQLEYGEPYISKETELPPYFRNDIKMNDKIMFDYQDVEGVVVTLSPDKDVMTVYNTSTRNLETYRNEDVYDIEIKSTVESEFKDEESKRFFIYKDDKIDITQLEENIEDDRIGKYISFMLYKPKSIVGKVIGHTPNNYIVSCEYDKEVVQVNYKDPSIVSLKNEYEDDQIPSVTSEDTLENKVSSSLRKYCFSYIYSKLINFIPDTIVKDHDIDIPELPEKDIMLLNLGITPFKESEIEWDDERKAFIFKWEFEGETVKEVIKYNGEIVDDLESYSEFIILRSQLEERAKNNFYNAQLKGWIHSEKYREFYDIVFLDNDYIEEQYNSYIKKNLDYKYIISSLLTRYGDDFFKLTPDEMINRINQEPNQHSFDVYLKMGLLKFPNYTSDVNKDKARIISQAFFNFVSNKEKDPITIKQDIIDKKIYQLGEEYEPTKDDIRQFEKQYLSLIKELYRNKFTLYLKSLNKKKRLDTYIDENIKNKTEAKKAKDSIVKEIYNNMALRGDFELTWKGLKILEDVKKLEEQIYSVSFFEPLKYISRIIEPIVFFDDIGFKSVTEYYQQSLKSGNIDIKDLLDLTLLEYFPELLLNKKNLSNEIWDFLMKKINIIKENALEDFVKDYINSKYFGKTREPTKRRLTVFKWSKGEGYFDEENTNPQNYLISVMNYCKLNTKNSNVGNYPLHNIYLYYNEVEDNIECYLLDKIFNSIEKGEENMYPPTLISKIKEIIRNKEGILDKKSNRIIFTKKNQILNDVDLESEINFSTITVILLYNEDPESLIFYDIWNDFFYGRPHNINYTEIFIPQYHKPKNILQTYKISKKELPIIIILNQQGELLKKIDTMNLTKYKLIGLIQNTLDD